MTPSGKTGWADRLARSLARVAEVQQNYYWDELYARHQRTERMGRDMPSPFAKSDPSCNLRGRC